MFLNLTVRTITSNNKRCMSAIKEKEKSTLRII